MPPRGKQKAFFKHKKVDGKGHEHKQIKKKACQNQILVESRRNIFYVFHQTGAIRCDSLQLILVRNKWDQIPRRLRNIIHHTAVQST